MFKFKKGISEETLRKILEEVINSRLEVINDSVYNLWADIDSLEKKISDFIAEDRKCGNVKYICKIISNILMAIYGRIVKKA